MKCQIDVIAAARPNFMKVAPLYHAFKNEDWCELKLVHTGQHYDANMSDAFIQDLGLPPPDFHLGIGSGTHAEQTAGVMVAYERICLKNPPDWIIVVGDVNSTAACALVGAKLCIPVAHLEAGLRSRDRTMPEEINRLVTDAIAELLWTPSIDADENLAREGCSEDKIDRIGNIMIDSYELLRERIRQDGTSDKLQLVPGQYGIVTLHRPSNVDDKNTLTSIITNLHKAAEHIEFVFVIHPRTAKRLQEHGLQALISSSKTVRVVEPLGYVEFMNLVRGARLIITDSGGIQEESTYLNIPCLTLRTTTERPITLTQGTNKLVSPFDLLKNVMKVLAGDWANGSCPELWDGSTAPRAVASLKRRWQASHATKPAH